MQHKTLIWAVGVAIVLIAVIAGVGASFYISQDTAKMPEEELRENQINTALWQKFSSEKFDFSLRYPADDWSVMVTPDDPIAPKFSFYIKPAGVVVTPPFDHFANITHVSVYPEGIPTEGLFAQSHELQEGWGKNIDMESSRVFTLEDGTPFAAYIKFKNVPESWGEASFAWARLRVENWNTICLKNGVETPEEQCDPLGSPVPIEIIHRGDVNKSIWPKLQAVIKSIEL